MQYVYLWIRTQRQHREHITTHVYPQNENSSVNIVDKKAEWPIKSILDEYDDDGNYIRDNPIQMDEFEQESEEEDG